MLDYCTFNIDFILLFKVSPVKSRATMFPLLSSKKVLGICSTSYKAAIGSSQPFKLETCIHVNLSFAMAFFHCSTSSSKETPIITNPLECNSLYNATTFGFSIRHGLHQDAQKSISVTFPNDFFKEIVFPSGDSAEKSGAFLVPSLTFFAELLAELDFFLLSRERQVAF